MTDELDDMLNGEQEREETETVERAEAGTEGAAAEADSDQEKGEEVKAPPAEPDPVKGLQAGISAERQKRQEAEFRVQMLERQLQQHQQPRQQQETPDFWSDPDAALQRFTHTMQQTMQQQRLDMSETYARQAHKDFDEQLATFADMAARDPSLTRQMMASANPAEFAYQTAKRNQIMQEIGDPESYEQRVRAKVLAELEAAQKAETEKLIKEQIPGSFSDTRGTGGGKSTAWTGPPSLDQILNG